jgi:hypothetical protein
LTSRSARALFLLLVLAIGCGREDSVAPAATPLTAVTPSATPAVNLVSQAELRAAVPELRGWIRGDIATQQSEAPAPGAHATATFTRGAEKMDLEIADTGGDPRAIESLEKIAGSTMNRKVGNGYFKGAVVSGFPAVESWNTEEKIGELSVLIRRRFIVHVAGSGLKDAAPMSALAQAVDASRLR